MERSLKSALLAAVLTFVPLLASAHERQAFRIGDEVYTLVVGFVNEPVFVGDKSGVDLRVRRGDPENAKPVEKLETSLRVEVSAGDQKQEFALKPVYREPGAYRATFFPSVAGTYGVRVVGKLGGTPVDVTFTCGGDGHAGAGEDRREVKVSDRVTRILKAGTIECPMAKETAEFPRKR